MRKRFLSILTVLALTLSLVPTSVWAAGEEVTESGGVLTGARWNEGGSLTPITDSKVTYTITENESGGYTLTFSGSGAIPDYYTETQGYTSGGVEIYKTGDTWVDEDGIAHEDGPVNISGDYRYCTSDRAHYAMTQWNQFGEKDQITAVVFEEGIEYIGRYTLFSMSGVTSIEIRNPKCEVSDNAIYYNNVVAPDCQITMDSTVDWKSNSIGYHNNVTSRGEISYQYPDAQAFVEENQALLSLDASSLTDENVAAIEDAYDEYMSGNEVFRDAVDTASVTVDGNVVTTFGEAFRTLYEAATGTDPDTIALKGYVLNSTVQYELTTEDDGKTYTLRFFDESGYGEMPDFVIDEENKENPERYQLAPWYDGNYRLKITHVIYDKSITRTGYLSAAHLYNCTQFDFLNPDVEIASATIHYNGAIQAESVKLRYSGKVENAGKIVSYNNGADQSKIKVSYYEAEQFEANQDYAALWTLSEDNAAENATLIQQAYRDYNKLADVVKKQLNTDTIPSSETTYADKLASLMAKLNLGGNVGGNIKYTLSLNDEDKYTLILTGSGEVPGDNLPWSAYASDVTEVVLSDGITGVAAGAFADLSALKSVDVAESVGTITAGAFPQTEFEMYGWLNHASGRYADVNSNVQLRMKELRILAIGNSHTGDYTNFVDEILADLAPAVETEVTLEVLSPMGGRGLVIEQGDRGSHLKAAQDKNDKTYQYYQSAFEKTWDLIIVQDYHESTARGQEYGGDGFAEKVMKPALEWLRDAAKGAKIAWFADWADGSRDDLDETYQQSVAAMVAVSAMEDGPDFIIPASTVLQNARTSFLGTTHNAEGTFAGYTGQFTIDFEPNSLPTYTLLERDSTHMSYEVGRQLMASAFLYSVFQNYADALITDADFNFFNQLETEPVYENTQYNVVWRGEFTEEIWAIIQTSCENAWAEPQQVTACDTAYRADPFAAKYDQVKNILENVEVDETALSEDYLEEIFLADAVVEALAAIPDLGIEKEDIAVAYTAPVDGTEDAPAGTSGSYTVEVDCHYGYTFPDGPALQKTILAKPYGDDGEHLQELKKEAIAKVNGFMSKFSYSGSYRTAVEKAKAVAAEAIAQATDDAAIKEAVQQAEKTIDSQTTIFELEYQTDVDCVARGQIWTGGWAYGTDGTINKDTFVMDVGADKDIQQNSEFTGVWWLIRNDGNDGYVIEFYPDPAIETDEDAYTFETPVFNADHWLDPMTQEDHSQNPLQYNQTPWFKGYRNTLTKAVVHSGVTINQHTLACYPNITEYVIEDGANLGTNAIYFNPLQNDTVIRFEGSSTVEKDAVSGYRVANSYEYYIDVYGDMGKVTISSRDDMDREPLQGNLYYAFGKYDDTVKAWIASARVYETIAVGLAGEGEDISTGAGFAPHYTDGVDDGTTMLRVFNNTKDHSHTEDSGNRILLQATAGEYPCQTGLSEGYVCKVCDAVIVPQQVIMGTEEHTWVSKVTKQPTATDRGEITFTCQGCGVTKIEYINRLQPDSDAVVSVNGVNYNSVQYAIDQADPGDVVVLLKDHKQDIHLDAEDDVLLDLNGHTLTGDIAVSGQLTIQASGDGGVVTGAISAENGGAVQTLSGTYSQDVASFCPDGYGVILNGDNTYTVHQHIWDAGTVTKPATETADGVRTYKCTVEGCTAQKTERIPATGTEEPDDDDRPSSGGGSSDPSYSPIFDVSDGGEIKVNPRTPEEEDEVTITVTPDRGYELDELIVTDRNGREIDVTAERDGTYTFIQPRGRVTIEATFVRTGETAGLPFVDVPASAYYYDAVAWAVENGVTGGTTATTFSPNNACTRAQMVTFLWRAAGEPEPETTVNPFTDVSASAYYYEAVLWAVERGITNGTSATTFSPDATVTRGQTVTFLWRNAGSPAASGSSFADVAADAYYATAVAWAANEGITSGTSATAFSPNNACTRAQIVTFLYRTR